MKVYVQSKNGNPLMPTSPCRARHLIEAKEAKVVKRTPYTIRLTNDSTENVQPVTLGVDAGHAHIGLSASTEKEELYSAVVKTRTDVHELMVERRSLRSDRRKRKTRYRAPRFSNRKRPEGWLTPTMECGIRTHESVIADVYKILPISKIIVETASFDIQKAKYPEIEGKEYLNGETKGYKNTKRYVKVRDGYKCRNCGSKKELEVHHRRPRSKGGSDRPGNLITLCHECHTDYHDGKIKLHTGKPDLTSFKAMTAMNTMRWFLLDRLSARYSDVSNTYGYLTDWTRNELRLEKDHHIDAFCIAGNTEAIRTDVVYDIRKVRSHNRKLHKEKLRKGGKRQANQAPRFVKGFKLSDKVLYNGKEGTVTARKSDGRLNIRYSDNSLDKYISMKKVRLLEHPNTRIYTRRILNSAPTQG